MGVKIQDLTGKAFGMWTVLQFESRRGKDYYWRCICKCGKEKSVRANSLIGGLSKSCGHSRATDLTGKRFERLLAISKLSKKSSGGNALWKCICDCGCIIDVNSKHLIHGSVRSCGCLREESVLGNFEFFEGTIVTKIRNDSVQKNNTSGFRGVCWCRATRKWISYISFKHKRYNLGRYDELNDAVNIRKQAEEKIFGEFLKWYDSIKSERVLLNDELGKQG